VLAVAGDQRGSAIPSARRHGNLGAIDSHVGDAGVAQRDVQLSEGLAVDRRFW
jgi:hypothetical protein